jgi:hypothetical protein
MSTATKSHQRVKPERRIRLLQPIRDRSGAIQITVGKERQPYDVRRLDSDYGVAYRLIKHELIQQPEGFYELEITACYDVLLCGTQSTCECKGFLHHGQCKHVDGLTVLRQRGLI